MNPVAPCISIQPVTPPCTSKRADGPVVEQSSRSTRRSAASVGGRAKARRLTFGFAVVAGLSILWGDPARAASSFTATANVTFTVHSAINETNPGDLTGLQIVGSFRPALSPPDTVVELTGDATVRADNSAVGPDTVDSSFSKTFAVSGDVGLGSLRSSHLGLFELSFSADAGNSYVIEFSLDYRLESEVAGELGDASVSLDYFDSDAGLTGSALVNANLFAEAYDLETGTSGRQSLRLSDSGTFALFADVVIAGNLEASASPVPLPAGVWLLVSAIAGLGSVYRRRTRSA